MNTINLYHIAADAMLMLHVCFVAFVILGLILILVGKPLGWVWIRNPWLRLTHLVAIGIVVLQSWFGLACPLTAWEMALRQKAGESGYAGGFIAHWLQAILYYQFPGWVFTLVYTLFGCAVAASWAWVRPRPFKG
jgi:hypothetical protein